MIKLLTKLKVKIEDVSHLAIFPTSFSKQLLNNILECSNCSALAPDAFALRVCRYVTDIKYSLMGQT